MKLSLLLGTAAVAAISITPLYAQDAGPSARESDAQRFPADGQVVVVNKFTGLVTIKTQKIPGLEGRNMTVWYAPKDTAALNALKEGEKVKGEIVVSGSDTHMENVTPAGKSTSDDAGRKTDSGKKAKSGKSKS